jgi:hypothetical protein
VECGASSVDEEVASDEQTTEQRIRERSSPGSGRGRRLTGLRGLHSAADGVVTQLKAAVRAVEGGAREWRPSVGASACRQWGVAWAG